MTMIMTKAEVADALVLWLRAYGGKDRTPSKDCLDLGITLRMIDWFSRGGPCIDVSFTQAPPAKADVPNSR